MFGLVELDAPQGVQAVAVGHANIQQHHVGLVLQGQLDRLLAGGRLGHDADVGAGQQASSARHGQLRDRRQSSILIVITSPKMGQVECQRRQIADFQMNASRATALSYYADSLAGTTCRGGSKPPRMPQRNRRKSAICNGELQPRIDIRKIPAAGRDRDRRQIAAWQATGTGHKRSVRALVPTSPGERTARPVFISNSSSSQTVVGARRRSCRVVCRRPRRLQQFNVSPFVQLRRSHSAKQGGQWLFE